MKHLLLEKQVAHRTIRVEIGPHEGRLVVSIGAHRDDGKGAWVNFDVRDVSEVIDALERAREFARGSSDA
jgi:hypothetical protein